jgi:hypothetical protein
VTCDVPTLQAKARASIDQAALLEVEVDGVALPNLFNYRAASPRPFSITVADGNVLGLDAGTYAPQVCDGYWLMLAPPWPGQHTVHFKAVNKDGKLAQEVTYHLTVACNPGVIPPEWPVFGKSYGEWGAAWWQWALGQPTAVNPVLDTTGRFAGVGQSGLVWFLAGTFGGPATRTCTVPEGKMLFFPVVNTILGAGVFDCNPSVPGVPCDVPVLQGKAKAAIDKVTHLEVKVDGVSVEDLFSYSAASPHPFSLKLPDGNVLGLPAGTYVPQVCDGYWLMLAPLSHGKHTIHFKSEGYASVDVTYYLTVQHSGR